uniref:Cystatin domain-containing protein n=1 Tax=Biomphalaria glabrata TaxID=6526 RepID=A0A2C9KW69_BIOGL
MSTCDILNSTWTTPESILNGWTEEKDVDDNVSNFAKQIRRAVERDQKQTFSKFDAIRFRKQIVNGWNYWVKVCIEEENSRCLHIKFWLAMGIDAKPVLISVIPNKTKNDPINV